MATVVFVELVQNLEFFNCRGGAAGASLSTGWSPLPVLGLEGDESGGEDDCGEEVETVHMSSVTGFNPGGDQEFRKIAEKTRVILRGPFATHFRSDCRNFLFAGGP